MLIIQPKWLNHTYKKLKDFTPGRYKQSIQGLHLLRREISLALLRFFRHFHAAYNSLQCALSFFQIFLACTT